MKQTLDRPVGETVAARRLSLSRSFVGQLSLTLSTTRFLGILAADAGEVVFLGCGPLGGSRSFQV